MRRSELRRQLIIGHVPEPGERIIELDDVFTTGGTKYRTKSLLDELLVQPRYPALVVAVDRQEVDLEGRDAIKEFTQRTGIPVACIVSATEIYQHLRENPSLDQDHVERIAAHLRAFGTSEARSLY